MLVHVKKDK